MAKIGDCSMEDMWHAWKMAFVPPRNRGSRVCPVKLTLARENQGRPPGTTSEWPFSLSLIEETSFEGSAICKPGGHQYSDLPTILQDITSRLLRREVLAFDLDDA